MEYMKLNHKRGAIPLYLQIYEILRSKIEGEAYVYGDLLPSELELEKHYHVSRITVRQAIAELEKEGYVKRARGKGTTVTYTSRINESLSEIRSFTKEMEERGRKPGTRYIDIRKTAATEEVANALGIEIGSEVYHLYRVRTADDEPIVIFETFLSNDYDFPLDKESYQGAKLPTRVLENFQAMLADKRIAELLQVRTGSPILKRCRISYNAENKAIEYTTSYYRGDRYSYSIQLGG